MRALWAAAAAWERGVQANAPHPAAVHAEGYGETSRRVKSVMVREWTVALTTASSDLNDDRTWEREICAQADPCVHVPSVTLV